MKEFLFFIVVAISTPDGRVLDGYQSKDRDQCMSDVRLIKEDYGVDVFCVKVTREWL